MRVQNSRIIRLENRVKGIQCNSIGPFSSASDQLPGIGSFYWPPTIKSTPLTSTSTSTYYSYVLILSSAGRCCGGFDHLFFAAGVVAHRGHPPATSAVQIILTNQTSKQLIPLFTGPQNNSLTAPHQFFRIPLYAIRYPKTKPHGSWIAPSKQGLSAPSAVQMQVKARDSQRDHWDLPDVPLCQTTEGLRLSALDDHVAQTCVNEERRGGPLLVSALAASPKQAPIQRLIRQTSISEIPPIVHQSQAPLCLMVFYIIDAVGLIFLSLHPD